MRPLMIACLALILAAGAMALEWSEIHFNPPGNDNGKEFIELIGTEDLEGCTVSDSASSDTLALVNREESPIILIVEADGIYNATPGATVYHAGLAIGNGLGNTADSITIACDGTTPLETAYNISAMTGHEEGLSIAYSGGWVLGVENGTPGTIPAPAGPAPESALERSLDTDAAEQCNDTLLLTLHAASGEPGARITFDIASAGYAWYDAAENGTVFAYGDTLEEEHAITMPETDARITAYARHCGGRQRMTRTVRAIRQEPPIEQEQPAIAAPQLAAPASPPTAMAVTVPAEPAMRTVVDQDRDAVPWIAAFGMVTVITSAAVFIFRREE